jgi:hypothetical protein
MQIAALISVVLSIIVAVITFVGLRHVPPTNVEPLGVEQSADEPSPASLPTAVPSPAGTSSAPSPTARESGR